MVCGVVVVVVGDKHSREQDVWSRNSKNVRHSREEENERTAQYKGGPD